MSSWTPVFGVWHPCIFHRVCFFFFPHQTEQCRTKLDWRWRGVIFTLWSSIEADSDTKCAAFWPLWLKCWGSFTSSLGCGPNSFEAWSGLLHHQHLASDGHHCIHRSMSKNGQWEMQNLYYFYFRYVLTQLWLKSELIFNLQLKVVGQFHPPLPPHTKESLAQDRVTYLSPSLFLFLFFLNQSPLCQRGAPNQHNIDISPWSHVDC